MNSQSFPRYTGEANVMPQVYAAALRGPSHLPLSPQQRHIQPPHQTGFTGALVPRIFTFPVPLQASHFQEAPFTPHDDGILADAIAQSYSQNRNLGEIMEELSGVNGHSTTEWVKYYIWNSQKIHERISSWISKPFFESQGRITPSSRLHESSFSIAAESSYTERIGKDTRRKNLQRYGGVLDKLSGHSRLKLPNCKRRDGSALQNLRSPKPPTRVVRSSNGYCRYTDEDKEYLEKFFVFILKKNPKESNARICKMIAERVPHHSVKSWQFYVSENITIINRIRSEVLRDRQLEDPDKVEDTEPKAQLDITAEPIVVESGDELGSSLISESLTPSDKESSDVQDMNAIATFIANDDNWYLEGMRNIKWAKFAMQVNRKPRRTPKAWSVFYRRNKKTIDQQARHLMIEKERLEQASPSTSHNASLTRRTALSSPDL